MSDNKKSKSRKEGASSFVDENPKGKKRLRTRREEQETKSVGAEMDNDGAESTRMNGDRESKSGENAEGERSVHNGENKTKSKKKEKREEAKQQLQYIRQLQHIRQDQHIRQYCNDTFITTSVPLEVHFQPKSDHSSQPASFSVRLRNPRFLDAFPYHAIGFGDGPDDPPEYKDLYIFPNRISGDHGLKAAATQHALSDDVFPSSIVGSSSSSSADAAEMMKKKASRYTTVFIYPVAACTTRPSGFPITIPLAADPIQSQEPSDIECQTWEYLATDMLRRDPHIKLRREPYIKDGQYITPAHASDKTTKMVHYKTWSERQPGAKRYLTARGKLATFSDWYTQVALPHAQQMCKRVPIYVPDSTPAAAAAASTTGSAQVSMNSNPSSSNSNSAMMTVMSSSLIYILIVKLLFRARDSIL